MRSDRALSMREQLVPRPRWRSTATRAPPSEGMQRRQGSRHPIGVFRLRRPSILDVRATLDVCADAPFTYREVGATATTPPSGYAVDRYGVDLGRGRPTFERGRQAIERFAMYPPAWTSIVRRDNGPLTPDLVFASVVRHLGFWSINPGRLIYVLDGDNCAGFGFGTLPGHAERGEERFEVGWNRDSDLVRFNVVAFSRPAALLVRIGAPIARALQRRFAVDACRAMREATKNR